MNRKSADDAEARVRAFCASWSSGDIDHITSFLAPDVVWENVPIGVVTGRAAVAERLTTVFDRVSDMRWDVLNLAIAANGAVLTERVDHMAIGDRRIALRLMGIFEVTADGISLWRDYFDLAGYRRDLDADGWV